MNKWSKTIKTLLSITFLYCLLRSLSLVRLNHLAIQLLQVGNVLEHLDPRILLTEFCIDRVSDQQNILQATKSGQFVQLSPALDVIIAYVEFAQVV